MCTFEVSLLQPLCQTGPERTCSFPWSLELVFKPQFIGPAQGPGPHQAPGSPTNQKPPLFLSIHFRCQELEIVQDPLGKYLRM